MLENYNKKFMDLFLNSRPKTFYRVDLQLSPVAYKLLLSIIQDKTLYIEKETKEFNGLIELKEKLIKSNKLFNAK